MTITKKGAGEGAEHQSAPFGCISVTTPISNAAVEVREGAEIVSRPASNIICITRSLASRYAEEIALV